MNVGKTRTLTDIEIKQVMGGCGWRTTSGTTSVNGEAVTTEYTDYYDCYGTESGCAFYDGNGVGGDVGGDVGGGGGGGDGLPPYLQELLQQIDGLKNNSNFTNTFGNGLEAALLANPTIVDLLTEFYKKGWSFSLETTRYTGQFNEGEKKIHFGSSDLMQNDDRLAEAILAVTHEIYHFQDYLVDGTTGSIGEAEAYAILQSAIGIQEFGYSLADTGANIRSGLDGNAYRVAERYLAGQITYQAAYDEIKTIYINGED